MRLLPEKLSKVRVQGTLRSHVRSVLGGQWLRHAWVLFHSFCLHPTAAPGSVARGKTHQRKEQIQHSMGSWSFHVKYIKGYKWKLYTPYPLMHIHTHYMYYHIKVLGYRAACIILKILQYTPCLKTQAFSITG